MRVHTHRHKHIEANLNSHSTNSQTHTCIYTQHNQFPPSSAPTPSSPGHPAPGSQLCPLRPLHASCQASGGYLAGVDNRTGSQQERVGSDGEQVQMVAVSLRCCMETNKPAEIGNLAPAWRRGVVLPGAGAQPGTKAWQLRVKAQLQGPDFSGALGSSVKGYLGPSSRGSSVLVWWELVREQ